MSHHDGNCTCPLCVPDKPMFVADGLDPATRQHNFGETPIVDLQAHRQREQEYASTAHVARPLPGGGMHGTLVGMMPTPEEFEQMQRRLEASAREERILTIATHIIGHMMLPNLNVIRVTHIGETIQPQALMTDETQGQIVDLAFALAEKMVAKHEARTPKHEESHGK